MPRTTGPLILAVFAAALTQGGNVRAEYWMGTAGELLSTATHVELLHVDAINAHGAIEATVTKKIRGDKPGTKVTILQYFEVMPTPGTEILYICDPYECPRAIGIDKGSYFQIHAQQPGDGATVLPGIVERASVAALTAGKAASDICIDVDVSFVDGKGAGAAGSFHSTFDPTNGSGSATGAVFGATQTRSASLAAPFDVFGSAADSVTINVTGASDSAAFTGGALVRKTDGCYAMTALPSQPVARTQHELETVLDSKPGRRVLGRGTIAVANNNMVSAGAYYVEIAVDADGRLEVASPIMSGTQMRLLEIDPTYTRLGFAHGTNDSYPLVTFDLGPTAAVQPAGGLSAQIATLLSAGAAALPVTWNDPGNGAYHVPLGTAAIAYVAAKK